MNPLPRVLHVVESWRPVPSGYASRSWWLVEEQHALAISQPAVLVTSRQWVYDREGLISNACCPVTLVQSSRNEQLLRETLPMPFRRPFHVDERALTAAIARSAQQHRATIIHAHWASSIGRSAAQAAKMLGIRFVAEMRFDLASAVFSQQTRSYLTPVEPFLRRWFDRHLAHANAIVAASEAMAVLLRQCAHLDGRQIHVVPNGMSDAFLDDCVKQRSKRLLQNSTRDAPMSRVVLGTTAKMLKYENLVSLILVAERLPNIDLVFIGDGPERAALEQCAIALNRTRANRVRFLGQLPAARIPEQLVGIDIFAIPRESRVITRHASPIKLIEAMAAGCSVVATAVGDSTRLLADGRGILVPPDDFDSLLQSVSRLADDSSLRGTLGERARQRIMDHYRSHQVMEQYRAVYNEALESH